jgi:rRNA-processing protein FCF1
LSLDRVAELSAILFASWRLCVTKIVSREDTKAQREKETAFAIRRGSLARYAYTRENSPPSKPNSPKLVAGG